jgi:hypothetical protein
MEERLIVGRKEGGNGEIKASRSHCEPLWKRPVLCVRSTEMLFTYNSFSCMCSGVKYEWKEEKIYRKDRSWKAINNCGKSIRKERSKTEIAQAYGILLFTLLTYSENRDSVENQALQGAEVSKWMRIRGAKNSNLEDELFEWFCHAHTNNIPVEGPMVVGMWY